ncbi:MAG: HAD-IA family hydrolase [Rhizobiales bacterium]|nr:HAD-IA family hydrolase [Hyphomicrobiales bacterium]MBI3673623.1 HAD-IA family hydrolase [Hyphomicrobiales bacterium]
MNLVFDLGNVLLRWDPRFLYRKLFADEARMEWFLATVCNNDWNLEQDRGRSFAEGVAEATRRHPELAAEIEAYDRRWHETLPAAIDASVAILEELAAAGHPLFAITNWNGEKFRETRVRFAFLGRFRDIVVSGDVGLIKPDPAIYRLLVARNGLDPARSLFIDDNAANVAGAVAVGMAGHHFTGPADLRAALTARGLL